VNSDGMKLSYKKFQNGEPNNFKNEDCLVGNFDKKEGWNDLDCSVKSSVICYKYHESSTNKATIMSPQGTFVLSYETMTFDKARSFCEQEGLKLIKPRDMATNDMIFKLSMAYRIGKYWIEKDGLRSEMTFLSYGNNKMTFERSSKVLLEYGECIYEFNGVVYDIKQRKLTRKIREANEKNNHAVDKYFKRKYDSKPFLWSMKDLGYPSMYTQSFWNFANCKAQYSVICA